MLLPIALTLLATLVAYLSVRLIVVAPLRRIISSLKEANTHLQNRCDAWAKSESAIARQLEYVQDELRKQTDLNAKQAGGLKHWQWMCLNLQEVVRKLQSESAEQTKLAQDAARQYEKQIESLRESILNCRAERKSTRTVK